MKEAIKRFMIKNGLSYKDYIIAYVIGYALTVGMLEQVIYSPIHMQLILNAIIILSVIAVEKTNVLTTWGSRTIVLRIIIKHVPIIILLCLVKVILNMVGINTEFILGV